MGKGKGLAELASDVQKLPQVMINVPVEGVVSGLETSAAINDAVRFIEGQLGETGRVILRASGTEPLVRVTLEGANESQVRQLATELAAVVRSELAG